MMRNTLGMFGYTIDLGDVPDKPKKKKRKRVKALSAPPKHRMMQSPIVAKGA